MELASYLKNIKLAKQIFVAALALKIAIYFVFLAIGVDAWYPTSDAFHYHEVAQGRIVNDLRAWGLWLKTLNDYGLYERACIASLIFISNCFLFPWLLYMSIRTEGELMAAQDVWLITVASIYPTLTFFSFDIYREMPMVLLYLAALIVVRKIATPSGLLAPIDYLKYSSCLLVILCATYPLRFYLAVSIVMALMCCYIFDTARRLSLFLLLFNIGLLVANSMGEFDWMKYEFRPSQAGAGSAYGIDFNHGYFLMNFWESFLANIYGVYMFGGASKLLFLLESVPAMILTGYFWINRVYIDRFVSFLIIFFFIYSAAWIVGIDVLGTAVRYRIFNYLALLMAAVVLYKNKNRQSVSTYV